MMNRQEYKNFINNSTFLMNVNNGLVVDADKTQSGLSFNTGQIYNRESQQQGNLRSPNMFYADGTQVQSNYMTPKNNKGAL